MKGYIGIYHKPYSQEIITVKIQTDREKIAEEKFREYLYSKIGVHALMTNMDDIKFIDLSCIETIK